MNRVIALFLAFSCLLAMTACGDVQPVSREQSGQLATVIYPEMAQQPKPEDYFSSDGDPDRLEDYSAAYRAWREDLAAMRDQPAGYADSLQPYLESSVRQFLSDAEGENRVFSPLSLAIALSMLAEVTDGQSRAQILALLGAPDLDALHSQIASLWQASYQDDGVTSSILANSFWLSNLFPCEQQTLDALAKYYYASSFQGKMGSAEYDQMLRDWLNEQTGGLLSGPASSLHMDPETVLALASTVYFKTAWKDKFSESRTESGVFSAPSGEQTVDFMHRSDSDTYYWGEHFAAVGLKMESDGVMWLILPDEGVSPEDLLKDPEAMAFLLLQDKADWEKQKFLRINLALPKFDVSSDLDLTVGLQALGITDVFDFDASDFSPLTKLTDEIALSQATHAARVTVDEEGCEAAAYTVMMVLAGASMPPDEEVDFLLDRPFLFTITNPHGLPLFTGLVNQPAQ